MLRTSTTTKSVVYRQMTKSFCCRKSTYPNRSLNNCRRNGLENRLIVKGGVRIVHVHVCVSIVFIFALMVDVIGIASCEAVRKTHRSPRRRNYTRCGWSVSRPHLSNRKHPRQQVIQDGHLKNGYAKDAAPLIMHPRHMIGCLISRKTAESDSMPKSTDS